MAGLDDIDKFLEVMPEGQPFSIVLPLWDGRKDLVYSKNGKIAIVTLHGTFGQHDIVYRYDRRVNRNGWVIRSTVDMNKHVRKMFNKHALFIHATGVGKVHTIFNTVVVPEARIHQRTIDRILFSVKGDMYNAYVGPIGAIIEKVGDENTHRNPYSDSYLQDYVYESNNILINANGDTFFKVQDKWVHISRDYEEYIADMVSKDLYTEYEEAERSISMDGTHLSAFKNLY